MDTNFIEYPSFEGFFEFLNKFNYVVIRNYEKYPEELFTPGHGDMDVLCENRGRIIRELGLSNRGNWKDDVHFHAIISGISLPIDLREVGDGYFCRDWERDMLLDRVMHKDLFYVMNEENYFYSLAYHSIVHKSKVSEEYYIKLKGMATSMGLDIHSHEDLYLILNTYLRRKGYRATSSNDRALFLNFSKIEKDLIDKKARYVFNHFIWNYMAKTNRIVSRIVNTRGGGE